MWPNYLDNSAINHSLKIVKNNLENISARKKFKLDKQTGNNLFQLYYEGKALFNFVKI